jgi:predicted RNase H-like HicB family nuclease
MKEKYRVTAEASDGGWALSFPEYPGAYSQGDSEEEVQFMAKDLIHEMLEVPLDEIELEITYIPESAIAQ